jgi:hypothetical protein
MDSFIVVNEPWMNVLLRCDCAKNVDGKPNYSIHRDDNPVVVECDSCGAAWEYGAERSMPAIYMLAV